MTINALEYVEAYVVRAFDEYTERDFDAALRSVNRALGFDPRSELALLLRSDIRMELHQSRPAIQDLNAVLRRNGGCLPARFRRAAVHLALGQHRAALRNYTAILERDPRNTSALHLRAAVLVDGRRLDAAAADLDRLLCIDPDHVEGRIDRGYVRFMRGDLNGAKGDLEQALDAANLDGGSAESAQRLLQHIRKLQRLPIRKSG